MAEFALTYRDYTVGWICALEVEQAAARALLDKEYPRLPSIPGDPNRYRFGSIKGHNVVIACLPDGETGNNPAATVATRMTINFPSLKFGLMVGIGGGVPTPPNYDDIRLGDVVVSSATGEFGGVVQFDRGKTVQEGVFKRTGLLNRPPEMLRQAVTDLRATYRLKCDRLAEYLVQMLSKYDTFASPAATLGLQDTLFKPDYEHPNGLSALNCELCDAAQTVQRSLRSPNPVVHYGVIASGNQVMKNGLERDRISRELGGVLCFEMEAAGLMNTFPCLVIRGICDYSDSHKNKEWQAYAAAIAAAYTKDLLSEIEPARVDHAQTAAAAMAKSIMNEQHLDKLPCANGAVFNSYSLQHEPLCLRDTRVDLLKQLREWANSPQGRCIFWLSGMAGTGKSTIARTIALECSKQTRLGASFFFSKGGGDRSHARMFFSTLALQLAEISPILKRYICEAIAKNRDIIQRGLSDQWQELVFQPLSKLDSSQIQPPTILLVIDALDECENQKDIRLILQLLAEAKDLQTIQLRVFVTSRPEFFILQEFGAIPTAAHRDFILHNISQSVVEHDISIFARTQLAQIQSDQELPVNWPSEQNVKLLIDRASGLFIYIATICRFIGKSKFPDRRLIQILQASDTKQGPERNLDEIYSQILRDSLIGDSDEQDKDELITLFQQTVGPIVVIFDLLSATALSKLLSVELRDIKVVLRYLSSVLDVPNKEESHVKLLHPSFRDFLLNKQRCQDEQFWIDERQAHQGLCHSCLQLMSNTLDKDICGLRKPGTLTSEVESSILARCLPSHVQYACRYWVDHLQRLGQDLREKTSLYKKVQVFLAEHFLHWLEALSLIGKISEGIRIITDLQSILILTKTPQLLAIAQDAKRFILYNRSIIEKAPLQVYASALVFSPKMSLIRRQFLSQGPTWIKSWPHVDENWSPTLQILEGHSDEVNAVAFSPDGQRFASASSDRTVRLWDAETGALQQTLEGHSDEVSAVAFSPDGQRLASASGDCTVRLWDAETGALQQTLEGHSGWVRAVAFSPDGQRLASASSDCTVRLWDAETGALQQTLEGHSGWVNAVAFSPDGQRLITDQGSIDLGTPFSISNQTMPKSLYSLDKDKIWIMWKGQNVLWLPLEYRPVCHMFQDNVLAIGCSSGRVTIIRFGLDVSSI